ncbi:MAG: RHS repeat-associated core domain-containing protein, partial [Ferruginibacter sp.]
MNTLKWILVCTIIVSGVQSFGQNINTPNKKGPLGTEVNTLSGNLFLLRNDIYIPSRELDISLTFYYNSFNFDQNIGFGNGWSNTYSAYYFNDTANGKIIVWGDGREDEYSFSGTDYIPQSGVFSKLILYQPNKYKIIEQNGRQYFFDNPVHKKLTRIEEPNGNFIQLNYTDSLLTGISNTAGQTITLAYNAAGNLQSITENVTTPAKTFTYSYDNAKNLTRVTDPLNGKINYSYLVNGPMKSLGDKNNNTVDIIYYGDYLAREIIGCNKRISFSYDSTLQETTVTEYLQSGINQTTHYKYQNIDKNVWLTSMTSNCCGNDVSFEYDRNGNKIKQTDANGNESTYTYDDRGNVLTIKDALNQTTTYTYSSDFNKITSITDPKGLKSILSYDVKGNLIQLIEPGNLVFTATYNSNGDITSSTNPKGNIFNYNYDALGNPLSVTGPNAYSATLSYDARGNLLSFKDARNNTSNLEYDILNRLKKITDPINNTIQLTYDAVGNATQVKNQNGENSLLQYDASNRLVQFTDAMGNKTNMQYDAMNNLTAIQNAVGGNATFSYDAKNRLTEIKDAQGNATNLQYDNKGNLISGTLPSGENFVYSYDEIDRLTKISDATGTLMELSFDANDNIIQLKNGLGSTIFAEYDSINRVKKIIDPSNNSMLLQYDKNSNIISITDRNGYTSSYTYDGMDRVKTFTDNNGSVTTADYDAQGNIIALTDANNNTTQYTYDSQNRIVRTIYPDGKYLEFTYNNKGNITNKRLADGSNILFAYDTLNRIVSKTIPGGQVFTYTYDAIGRIKTATNNAGVVAFEYDVLNRIISENFGGRTIQYAYNTAGRTQTTVYPDSTLIAKVYDTRNRLININKNGNRLVTYQYNNANQLISKTYANGIITNYQYNTANQLISYSTGNAIQNAILTYDNEMHKTSITRQNNLSQSEQFTYDNGHRLTQYKRGENGNPTIQNSYTYDALGNRTQANLNGVNTQYTPNNLNQLINSNNGTLNINFTYDDRGNLTYDGYFYKTYDALGRLMKDSAAPSNIITYAYDALGRRIQKNVNGNISNYTFSGLAAIEERDGVGNIKNKTIFNDFTTPVVNENAGTEFYYHQNELNSVEAITNNNGLLTEQYLYDVYGKQTMLDSAGNVILSSITGNRFGFTGQVYDSATGQIQFLFRTYNPSTGTFNERDLIGYADGMGMYQYVGNNPANGIDVFGLAADPCDPTKASTDWGLYNSTINFISTVDGKFEGLGRVQKMIDAKLSEGKKFVKYLVDLKDILRKERNWDAARRVGAEALSKFKNLGLLDELSKYAKMAKNGVQLAGRVTGVIDLGVKLYNYWNIISDLNSSWTDVARGIA